MKLKVGNITKIRTGKLDANASSPDGKYPFFTCSKNPLKISTYSYDCECVLVAGNGDLNVKYYNGKFDAYQRTYIIEDNSNGLLYMPYLYYFFEGYIEKLRKQSIGGVIKYIKLGNLTNALIELPSIEEQKYIVNLINISSELIDLRRETINKLDSLVKARFIEMFGNPATPGDKFKTCKLGEVADVKSSHRVFSTEFVNEGVPFYRGTEISVLASGQQPEDPYRISMDHYLKIASDDSKPIRGDLLLPSICNKGQVWMVNTDEPFYYKDGRVLCISPHCSLFDSRYLQFYMKMRTEAEYPKLGSGSTFAEFKIFQLKELLVDIPPMNAQKSFCLFADQVDKSKLAVQKSLEKTQQLFDSLMQEYFG